MSEDEFVKNMQTYEQLDINERWKSTRNKLKRKEKQAKEQAAKAETTNESRWTKKAKGPDSKVRWGSRTTNSPARTGPRPKKFCQHCKESGGQFWTHNTEDCYFKKLAAKPAAKASKEANMLEEMKKEIKSFKKIIKHFSGPKDKDSDSE